MTIAAQTRPSPAGTPVRTIDQLTLGRAARNIRRHWIRDAVRVSVLVTSDILVFLFLREIIRGLRDSQWLGEGAASLVGALVPLGLLGGWRFVVALVGALLLAGAYGAGQYRRDTGRVLAGVALGAALVLYAPAWEQSLAHVVGLFAAVVLLLTPALSGARHVVDIGVRKVRSRVVPHRTLVVSHADVEVADLHAMFAPPSDLTLADTLELDPERRSGTDQELRRLGSRIDETGVDTVVMWGDLSEEEFSIVADAALAGGCRLLAGPRTMKVAGVEPKVAVVNGQMVVELTAPSLQGWQLVAKRAVDVVGSMAGLVMLSPFLLPVALLIKLDSKGPVLFGQWRVGAQARLFRCFKFRSMKQGAEALLSADPALHAKYVANHFKLPEHEDPRLTRMGRLLRKTSLDELPQLLNVLRGEMSLVGPRPVVPDELDHYGSGGAQLFVSLKPGMTGAWAVSGRSTVGYPDRARMELEYIRTWTLWTDVGILLRTLPAVLRGRGAH
jgi:exopolysaccharide biosynthesis polyprenyl glycosylphosphotransferase